eukprot:7327298-Pyramimonas_sp.AAC.1
MAPRRFGARPSTRTTDSQGHGGPEPRLLSREFVELPRAMRARQSRIARARARSHGRGRGGDEGVGENHIWKK